MSEKDSGVYNALNKGVTMKKGECLLFLNSGCFLVNNYVLEKASKEILNSVDFVFGNLEFLKKGKQILRKYPEKLTFSYLVGRTLSLPISLCHNEQDIRYVCKIIKNYFN